MGITKSRLAIQKVVYNFNFILWVCCPLACLVCLGNILGHLKVTHLLSVIY